MTRVALVVSEPIRPAMGGIGVRYLELARRLPAAGFDTVLISPGAPDEAAACGLDPAAVRRFEAARLADLLADRDVVVAQGQLANDVVLLDSARPVVVDLYDPWLIENFQYLESLGLEESDIEELSSEESDTEELSGEAFVEPPEAMA